MPIPPPKSTPAQPNHILDCKLLLEPHFQQIVEEAQATGWRPEVVALALSELATARLEMLAASAATGQAIKARNKRH